MPPVQVSVREEENKTNKKGPKTFLFVIRCPQRKDKYKNIDQQLTLETAVYKQIGPAAERTWNKLPAVRTQGK